MSNTGENTLYSLLHELQYTVVSDDILNRTEAQGKLIDQMNALLWETIKARVDATNVSEAIFHKVLQDSLPSELPAENSSKTSEVKIKKSRFARVFKCKFNESTLVYLWKLLKLSQITLYFQLKLRDWLTFYNIARRKAKAKESNTENSKTEQEEKIIQRTLIFDKELLSIYPYAAWSQIKTMLRVSRDDRSSFRLLIEVALRTWDEVELNYLAESLVHFFLCDPESESPYDPLWERLPDIIDIDMKLWKESGCIEDIMNTSFSAKLLTQIVQLPDARHYIQKTFSKFYDEIDYEYLDNIDFEELSRALGKTDTSHSEQTRKRLAKNSKFNGLEKIEEELYMFEAGEDSELSEINRHEEMFGEISEADHVTRDAIGRGYRLSGDTIEESISENSSSPEKVTSELKRESNLMRTTNHILKSYSEE